MVREAATDAIQDIHVGEVIEDMIEAELENQAKMATAVALYEEKARESELVFNIEAEKNLYDQVMFNYLIQKMATQYDQEEKDLIDQKEEELKSLKQSRKKIQD